MKAGLAQTDYTSPATPTHLSAQWATVPVLGKSGKPGGKNDVLKSTDRRKVQY